MTTKEQNCERTRPWCKQLKLRQEVKCPENNGRSITITPSVDHCSQNKVSTVIPLYWYQSCSTHSPIPRPLSLSIDPLMVGLHSGMYRPLDPSLEALMLHYLVYSSALRSKEKDLSSVSSMPISLLTLQSWNSLVCRSYHSHISR